MWAETKGFQYFETSAQTGQNVVEMFQVEKRGESGRERERERERGRERRRERGGEEKGEGEGGGL